MGAFFVGWLLLIVVITFQKINQMDIMGFKCAKKVESIVLLNNNSKRNTNAHLVIILFCSRMVSLSSVYRLICEQHWTIGFIIWLTNYLLSDWYNKIIFAVFSINSMINLGEYCTSLGKLCNRIDLKTAKIVCSSDIQRMLERWLLKRTIILHLFLIAVSTLNRVLVSIIISDPNRIVAENS